jgi:hypothetical protein
LQSLNTRHWEHVYAPAIQSGHVDHDGVGRVASTLFPKTKYYSTYTKDNYDPFGQRSIIPTQAEINLKNDALACYESQLKIEEVRLNHFEMVRGKPEYLNDTPYSWRALDAQEKSLGSRLAHHRHTKLKTGGQLQETDCP